MDERIRELIARYPVLAEAERAELHGLLEERYGYGSILDAFPCPNCGKPLSFTFGFGVACLWRDGGCGEPWKKAERADTS